MTNYANLTNTELLGQVTPLLTVEEIKTIENMVIGLKVKLIKFNEFKRMLLKEHSHIATEVLEHHLAKALAITKRSKGSSLIIDADGQFEFINNFGSDMKISDKDIDNFKFMSSLSNTNDKDLEVMIMESMLRKIIELSSTILENIPADLIVEIKNRITGIKPVELNKVKMLKFN